MTMKGWAVTAGLSAAAGAVAVMMMLILCLYPRRMEYREVTQ